MIKAVNVCFLEENIGKLLSQNKIKEESGVYIIDLEHIGYNKLLGKGKVTKKFRISCSYASNKVIEAVKYAGGEIIIK